MMIEVLEKISVVVSNQKVQLLSNLLIIIILVAVIVDTYQVTKDLTDKDKEKYDRKCQKKQIFNLKLEFGSYNKHCTYMPDTNH